MALTNLRARSYRRLTVGLLLFAFLTVVSNHLSTTIDAKPTTLKNEARDTTGSSLWLTARENRSFKSQVDQSPVSNELLFEDIGVYLPGIWQGSAAWGDYDGDDDLDVLLTGYGSSAILRNDGNGIFTDIEAGLQRGNGGNVAWGDYDQDGDLDVLLTGQNNINIPASTVYRNDGNDIFTDINARLTGVWSFTVTVWGDYDNDGDLDILIAGLTRSDESITRIYRNEGNDIFNNVEISILDGVAMNSMAWGDYDNDDDLDMLWTGWSAGEGTVSKVYQNNGGGNFTDILAPFENVNQSAVDWGDYDNDGDLDILLAGWSNTLYEVSRIYRNDGANTFTDIHAPLVNVARGPSTDWGDYDNDGDLDVLIRGCISWDNDFGACFMEDTAIFTNNGADSFTELYTELPPDWEKPVIWGDYDNDGDLDILVTGGVATLIYGNNSKTPNSTPAAPDLLRVSLVGVEGVRFEWNAGHDSETPTPGLHYNLRVGTTPGGIEIVAPMAGKGGYRQLPQIGNAGPGLSATLKNLPPGTYYWGVQAIDTAFAGSPFAAENSFTKWALYLPSVQYSEP